MAKKFKIEANLLQGISESIGSSQSSKGNLATENIPLARIELDPENSRKLAISIHDIINGIDNTDPLFQQKQAELEDLMEFGEEIKEDGIIQPITVYHEKDKFFVIAGERRVLSSLSVKLEYIPAIIRKKPSTEYKLSRIQWNENEKRKNLTLWEKLSGIERLINSYISDIEPAAKVNAALISKVANLKKTEAYRYLSLIQATDDVKSAIRDGVINNLKKAEVIAKINNDDARANALKACEQGETLEALQSHKPAAAKNKTEKETPKKRTGRKATQVILGKTKNTNVAKKIFDAVKEKYHIEIQNEPIWDDLTSINELFRQLVQILEKDNND